MEAVVDSIHFKQRVDVRHKLYEDVDMIALSLCWHR